MNLVLLFPDDFLDEDRVRFSGRRLRHVLEVHGAKIGDELVVGAVDGCIGRGRITSLDQSALEMRVTLDRDPPPPLEVTLVLALPRPKVLNRVIAAAVSMGVKRIALVNAWRVEKSYWSSPRLSESSLLAQSVAGLEQAKDTVLPEITLHRLFVPFVASLPPGSLLLAAHPTASHPAPRSVAGPVTLFVGPEGGFIDRELASLAEAGFTFVSLGERVLRVETAVPALLSRLK